MQKHSAIRAVVGGLLWLVVVLSGSYLDTLIKPARIISLGSSIHKIPYKAQLHVSPLILAKVRNRQLYGKLPMLPSVAR